MVIKGRKESHIIGVKMWLVYAVIYKEDLIVINKYDKEDSKISDICKIVTTGGDLEEAISKVKKFLTEKVKDKENDICNFEIIKAEKFERLDGIDYILIAN